MKTKLRKIMYTAAAALFIGGLAINVYMTLDDPFENVSSLVLAQKTDTGTGDDDSGNDDGTAGGTELCNDKCTEYKHHNSFMDNLLGRNKQSDERDCEKRVTQFGTTIITYGTKVHCTSGHQFCSVIKCDA